MKYAHILFGVCSLALVAGCNGGTTYGTGTTHEEATAKSFMNMLALSQEKQPKVDYEARPDLVMPASKDALPQPVDEIETVEEDWPISPEERIAAVREAAPDEDDRSGEIPLEFMLSEKEGIGNSATLYNRSLRRNEKDGGQFIKEIKKDAAGITASDKLKKKREQLTYSTSASQRKYLVEPPSEYRTPAETAEAGDVGIDSEELEARQKENKRKERQNDLGMWTDG